MALVRPRLQLMLATVEPNTFCPRASKTQILFFVSHSIARSKKRVCVAWCEDCGFSALDLWEPVPGRKVPMILAEDNDSTASIICSRRDCTMRRICRCHGVIVG